MYSVFNESVSSVTSLWDTVIELSFYKVKRHGFYMLEF